LQTDKSWFVKSLLELIQTIQGVNQDGVEIQAKSIESKEGSYLEISLFSETAHFSEEQRKNIFKPFYFIKNSSPVKDVGLAKVKGFFNQMNATITLSKNGFIITMPCQ